MNTKFTTKEEASAKREWLLFDASKEPVGRLASRVAAGLRGKDKTYFAPHTDCGDFVVVINADKAVFTGNKMTQKTYYRHSGYIGGLKEEKADKLLARAPEEIIRRAVKGMMPSTNLAHQQLSKLKVYAGEEHPHSAQQPKTVN